MNSSTISRKPTLGKSERVTGKFQCLRTNISPKNKRILENLHCLINNNSAKSINKRFNNAVPKSPKTWRIVFQFQQEEAFANYKIDRAIKGDLGFPDNTSCVEMGKKQRDKIQKILARCLLPLMLWGWVST